MDPLTSPPPPAAILQLIVNMWATRSAATFAKLRFADILAHGPARAEAVAAQAGTHPDATYRLLRGLVPVGLVTTGADGRFALTPVGECLRAEVPGSMRALLIAEMGPGHWLPWGDMEHSVRTGEPATMPTLGQSVWQYYVAHPEEARDFAEGMSGVSAMITQAVLEAYSFAGATLVVDVGGSQGSLLAAVLGRERAARGILFDQPDVIAGARPALERAGVASRVTAVGGSFFERVPAGGDLYLLKNILHDWNDAECVTILTACRTAMAEGGRIAVLEMLIDADGPPSPAPLMDLNMLVMLTGRERTREEYAAIFDRAGLVLTQVVRTASPFVVIEAHAR